MSEGSCGAASSAPLVSVVIANYNRWAMLRAAIESVLAQSFEDFELIVVDDGSTDGSADHVEADFPTVRLIRQPNAERGAAYNHGVGQARGRFVALLDNDDVFEPWHLDDFSRTLSAHPEGRLFACRAALWDPATGRRKPLSPIDPERLARDALVRTVIPYQAMVIERAALLEVGGLPEQRAVMGCDDWVLLMNLAHRWRVHPMPRCSVLIREHDGRSMRDLEAISDSREEATRLILRGELLRFPLDAESRRLLVAGTHRLTASHRYAAGDMRAARASMGQVLRTLGVRRGLPWTMRLWAQSWIGPGVAEPARRLRNRVVWRRRTSRLPPNAPL